MKPQRCILLIDDKDQSEVADSIKMQLRDKYDLEFILIRTAAPEYKKDDSEELDLSKLNNDIRAKIRKKSLYVALTDFDLDSEIVNGLDIMHMVHESRPKVKFLIYSGNWNEVIRTVIGNDFQKASLDELVGGIKQFLNYEIVDCINRTDYQNDLIEYLNKNKSDSIEHRLSKLLRANGEMVFESCFPEFKGKTFNDIADMVDNQSDARIDEWIDAILTQTIAYLLTVNK